LTAWLAPYNLGQTSLSYLETGECDGLTDRCPGFVEMEICTPPRLAPG
jgi:hypothetical protein